ncbi:MAG: HEPN domain-containing protein [Chloroflexota bacterium]
MKEYSRKLLDKAIDIIEAAEILVDNEKPDIAAGRAYYAMFYIAEALLNERGLKFNKHSAVHAAFGEHFAKTKEMDIKFHRWLLNSFDKRQIGDYGVDTNIEKDVAVNVIHQAREFLEAAQKYLDKQQT